MKRNSLFVAGGLISILLVGGYNYAAMNATPSEEHGKTVEKPLSLSPEEESSASSTTNRLEKEFTLLKKEQERVNKVEEKKEAEEKGIVPARIQIPAIDVDADVEKVGLLESGAMDVPKKVNNVGWFEPGVRPGGKGNAVLAGHVDSKTGPAIFFNLKKLKAGDEIILTDKYKNSLTFVVQDKESYLRDDAPLQKIFGPASESYLNLITCTGKFDRSVGTHQERLVVYTKLKKAQTSPPTQVKLPDAPTNVKVSGSFVTWYAVRSDDVIGYRVYRDNGNGGFQQVASIAAHQRKTYLDEEASKHTYYVTAIDENGNESKPSAKASGE
ncbi:sortase [Priestia koreensis]|uniref:class F sortase n=1 Tax=Priestia koreensis TaxID=284581 RepID=UPI0028F6E3BC|nr:sortase [Priestia koreensis]